ncbi:hypothetical protein ScPMuIL_003691 [Solemya velum]
MGNYLSRINFNGALSRVANRPENDNTSTPRKRKREHLNFDDEYEEASSRQIPDQLNTPKRKRLKSTSKYIYQTLFLDGENSDITIVALGRRWPLHKLYLCQSPYFSSMFSGSWKESELSEIQMDIFDTNIDENALKIAFGSLYKDGIFMKPVDVVGVLAAASLLQLDGLIDHCLSMMQDNVSSATLCGYYIGAQTYGMKKVEEECLTWVLQNLLTSQDTKLLNGISIDMMKKFVTSPDLFVMQVEMDIYTMLKRWLFLTLHPTWSGEHKDLCSDTDGFFKNNAKDNGRSFLQSEEGGQFTPVFKELRWQHIISDMASIKILERDNIINMCWIEPVFQHQWKQMIQIEQKIDKGPESVEDDIFGQQSIRCGRILQKEATYCWRWVGYSYGLDLLVMCINRMISIKRNTSGQICPHSVDMQSHRTLYYRLRVASRDPNGKPVLIRETGIERATLEKDGEVTVMTLDKALKFPIYLSMNLMLISPSGDFPNLEFSSQTDGCLIDDESQTNISIMNSIVEEPSTLSHSDQSSFESAIS